MKKPKLEDRDIYFTTKSGFVANISDLLRINAAVEAAIKPGMSEAEIDQLITETVKRFTPN